MKIEDDDMRDVLWLDTHPGWTWADMMTAPDAIVEGLRLLDVKRAQGT